MLGGCRRPQASVETATPVAKANGVAAAVGGRRVPARDASDLRGFGKVSATFSAGRAEFVCQSRRKANILQGKLLADMFWDAARKDRIPVVIPQRMRENLTIAKRHILIYVWPPYGAIVVGRVGPKVIAVGADTVAALRRTLTGQHWWRTAGVRFQAGKPYPIYLDFYDLRAFKSYTAAMTSSPSFSLASHWRFIKKFGLGGIAIQAPSWDFDNPAPGVMEWADSDYEVRQAQREHGLIVPSIGGSEMPFWAYDQFTRDMMQSAPTALLGAWCYAGLAGGHYLSWWASPKAYAATKLAFLKQVMRRYRSSPAVGGWQIYGGAPGAENNFHYGTDIYWDYSACGEAGFRHWLKAVKGYSLQTLGRRWHGSPTYFKSWNQVHVPSRMALFGQLNSSCLMVRHWSWQLAETGKTWVPPTSKAGWVKIHLPPAQMETLLPWKTSFYKARFNAAGWLAKNSGKAVYLVVHPMTAWGQKGCGVWLNGRYLGTFKGRTEGSPDRDFDVEVTKSLASGVNRLILLIPGTKRHASYLGSGGKLMAAFFTTHKPQRYPDMGPYLNARWVDLEAWQAYSIHHALVPLLELARREDPNRPMGIAAQTTGGVTNGTVALARRYRLSVQFTGGGPWYYPWNSGMGYVAGFYGTTEPGGTLNATSLSQMTGDVLLDGDGNVDLFQFLDDYEKLQQKTHWFTKNQRLIQLFGKYRRAKPSIVLMRSGRNLALGNSLPWFWDLGRGELQQAGYDNVYATPRMVTQGLCNSYPVVMDAATVFMSRRTVAGLKKYVRQGGTFIAIQCTGRDTYLRPNTWPISALTGFQVVATHPTGNIRFGRALPILANWRGKVFNGTGPGITGSAGIGLKPVAPGSIALAKWANGTVAIGYRKIGKGRVIVLGSSFWRNQAADVGGWWRAPQGLEEEFLHDLFLSLGIRRNALAENPDVWAREMITKNGLQTWLLAYNVAPNSRKATLKFRVSSRPPTVWNLLTKKPVPYTYARGWVKISAVKFAPFGVQAFAVQRRSLVGGLAYWWRVKREFWKSYKPSAKTLNIPPTTDQALAVDRWKFYADRTGAVSKSAAWRQASFNDRSWQSMSPGFWGLLDPKLQAYQGLGLYRAKLTIPAAWKGRQIAFWLYSFNNPIVYNLGKFYLNGHLITTYKARSWSQTLAYNITRWVHWKSPNELTVRVTGGKNGSGICGCVWVAPLRHLVFKKNISKGWTVFGKNYKATGRLDGPAHVTAKYCRRRVRIPTAWKGRQVYLRMRTPVQCVSCVVVNGHLINYNAYLHPFGLIAEVNVTPYLRFGQSNALQLWGSYTTIGTPRAGELYLPRVVIGCAK